MRGESVFRTAWPVVVVFVLVLLPPGLTFEADRRYRVLPNELTVVFAAVEAIVVTTFFIAVVRNRPFLQSATLTAFCASGVASNLGGLSFLIGMVLDAHGLDPQRLLYSALYLWTSNTLFFALLYWGLDGGGPASRTAGARPRDFIFPEMQIRPDQPFLPNFADYVYLAFSTSTAFSATDTLTASSRVRALVVTQSAISLATVAIIAARAVNLFPAMIALQEHLR